MSIEEFDIIFRGDIILGHSLAEVKQRLQQLFKTDAARVDALFTGRPVPLKRNLDAATAEKYRDVLTRAGAQVDIRPAGTTPSPAERPVPVRRSGWSLAPVGSFLLTPSERPVFTPVAVDTSSLSLKPAEGYLLDSGEQRVVEPAAVDVPDFDVAEVGADLLSPEERPGLPLVSYEAGDWELAEAGADLLSAGEKARPDAAPVVVGDYGLAPVGSDLGQIKPQVKPVTPDISGIRLAE